MCWLSAHENAGRSSLKIDARKCFNYSPIVVVDRGDAFDTFGLLLIDSLSLVARSAEKYFLQQQKEQMGRCFISALCSLRMCETPAILVINLFFFFRAKSRVIVGRDFSKEILNVSQFIHIFCTSSANGELKVAALRHSDRVQWEMYDMNRK